jgi:hypothetical protein
MHVLNAKLIPIALGAILFSGCATGPAQGGRVLSRLSPEEVAALPIPDAARAAEATRLTRQADREAKQAKQAQEAERRRDLDYQRWREHERLERWPAYMGGTGYWQPYSRWGWGGWYGFP